MDDVVLADPPGPVGENAETLGNLPTALHEGIIAGLAGWGRARIEAMMRGIPKLLRWMSMAVLGWCAALGCASGGWHGRDYLFGVTGVVTSEDGSPLEGAEVTLEVDGLVYQAVRPVKTERRSTTTTGGFVFMYISHGRAKYAVIARKEGYETQTVSGSAPPAEHHTIRLKREAAARPAEAGPENCGQPLVGAAEGWTVIPAAPVDSAPGAYHDAHSGAFVSFDGFSRGDGAGPEEARQDGVHHGVPYRMEVIPSVRDYVIATGRRNFGPDYPEGMPGAEDFLPMKGAKRLDFTFFLPQTRWRFTADIYSEQQEARVRKLLVGTPRLCGGFPTVSAGDWTDMKDVSRMGQGESVGNVLRRLGMPVVVRPDGRAGFALRYTLTDRDQTVRMELHFSQQQRLVDASPVQ